MRNIQITLLTAVCMAAMPAWAINKCTIEGKLVFQDAPCPGKGETLIVRPASGSVPKALPAQQAGVKSPTEAGNGEKPLTKVEQIEQQIAASQLQRRKQLMEVRLVPDAESAVHTHRAKCDRDMKALQAKKALANNNLAGATWENAISGEMTALATTCDTRNRELRENAAALRAECLQLGGCQRQ